MPDIWLTTGQTKPGEDSLDRGPPAFEAFFVGRRFHTSAKRKRVTSLRFARLRFVLVSEDRSEIGSRPADDEQAAVGHYVRAEFEGLGSVN